MFDIFDETYYIDFAIIDAFLGLDPNDEDENIIETQKTEVFNEEGKLLSTTMIETATHKPKEINGIRFELIRGFIDDISNVVLENGELTDIREMSIAFKLAFNTLTAYGILKPIKD